MAETPENQENSEGPTTPEEQPVDEQGPEAQEEMAPEASSDDTPAAEESTATAGEESGSEQDAVESSEADDVSGEAAKEPPAAPEEGAKQPEQKKREAIPGADLEPIAVEPEEKPLSAEERARREADEEERARREAALSGESDDEDDSHAAQRAPAKMESGSRYLATGKRKRSIARVTLLAGSGKIEVNSRPLDEFFPRPLHRTMARQPLATTGYEGTVDVRVRVHGGGISGQAGAVRHGIARALTEIDPELRGELKRRGFLTRDARVKERRKAGLKKARKRPQFSKR